MASGSWNLGFKSFNDAFISFYTYFFKVMEKDLTNQLWCHNDGSSTEKDRKKNIITSMYCAPMSNSPFMIFFIRPEHDQNDLL